MPATQKRPILQDQFRSIVTGPWKICEAKEDEPSYDKEIYLARLRGPMALYDGSSLNGRWYSKKLWENTIAENQDRMANDGMFGTLGHDRAFDEEAIESGLVTHKITGLWLNEVDKTVHGEILVLNTSAGRELNTYLRSGMKISTSSRAYGTFKGKTPDGADIIDENGFYLHGFDFVLNPGVEAACPRLVESLNEERKTKMELNEKQIMENAIEKAELKVQISEAQKKADKAEQSLSLALNEKAQLKTALTKHKGALASVAKSLNTDSPAKIARSLNEGLAKWMMVPELQELAKEVGMFDNVNTTMDQTVKKIVESHARSTKALRAFEALGKSPEAIQEALKAKDDELAAFKAHFESPAKLEESLNAWAKVGSSAEKSYQALKLLEAYIKVIGKNVSPEDLQKRLDESKKASDLRRQAMKIATANKIRVGLKMHESHEPRILKMLDKMTAKEVVEHLKAFRKTNESKEVKPSANASKKSVQTPTKVPTKVDESAKTNAAKKVVNGGGQSDTEASASRALRLVESVNKNYNPVTTPDPFQTK